jgi:alkylation response protein AidB-like acyl-CoA dehydrogenase
MERELYEAEHRDFGESFSAFLRAHVTPDFPQWEDAGIVPHEVFGRLGREGFAAFEVDERYGGVGIDDFRFNAILAEQAFELDLAGFIGMLTLHNDICLPYFLHYANEEQRERWLPGIVNGELLTAVAMTEPGTGSDLAGIATRAVVDGDDYIVNGSKTFITNGINSDLVITAVRTDLSDCHGGLSLVVIERGMEGFERGRNLEKVGLHSADTAEMSFADVRVPRANLLGEEGMGFRYLTSNLPRERLSIAVSATAMTRRVLDYTL